MVHCFINFGSKKLEIVECATYVTYYCATNLPAVPMIELFSSPKPSRISRLRSQADVASLPPALHPLKNSSHDVSRLPQQSSCVSHVAQGTWVCS